MGGMQTVMIQTEKYTNTLNKHKVIKSINN